MAPDGRGVLLGQKGSALFPSLDRAVAFLRAYGEENPLDELLSGLQIHKVVTPFKTRELLLTFVAESSYRMDRVAAIARLLAGFVFTGTSRHFVRYRDANSPLGYDVMQLHESPDDFVLYDTTFEQGYGSDGVLRFDDLLTRLDLVLLPKSEVTVPARCWLMVEPGLAASVTHYLARWDVAAKSGLLSWPQASAFDEGPHTEHVYQVDAPPERMLRLFAATPGICVLTAETDNAFVEWGYAHALPLAACSMSLDASKWHFYRRGAVDGSRTEALSADRVPLVPVHTLVRMPELQDEAIVTPLTVSTQQHFEMTLRVVPTENPWTKVRAIAVSVQELDQLTRLLYALPHGSLDRIQVACTDNTLFLLDSLGVDGLPVGRPYSEVTPHVYVPAGATLSPSVSSRALHHLVPELDNHEAFFDESGAITLVARAAFGPVSLRGLHRLRAQYSDASPISGGALHRAFVHYEDLPLRTLAGVPTYDADAPTEAAKEGGES